MEGSLSYLLSLFVLYNTFSFVITQTTQCYKCTDFLLGRMLSLEKKFADMETKVMLLERENTDLQDTIQELQTEISQLKIQTNAVNETQDALISKTFRLEQHYEYFNVTTEEIVVELTKMNEYSSDVNKNIGFLQSKHIDLENQTENINKIVWDLRVNLKELIEHTEVSINASQESTLTELELLNEQIQKQNKTVTELLIDVCLLKEQNTNINNTIIENLKLLDKSNAKILQIETQLKELNWTDTAPAFTVRLASNIQTSTILEKIVFSHVVTNVGNCYNVTDGVFRPPVSGRYVFSLTVRADGVAGVVHAVIMKNNTMEGVAISIGNSKFWGGTGASTLVFDLNQGDNVHVAGRYANETYQHIATFFTGYLLYPSRNNGK